VRNITGRKQETAVDPSITAKSLNRHYAAISTDKSYEEPLLKQTALVHLDRQRCITEYAVLRILDKLRPTATGLGNLPSRFLRLAVPVLSRPIADLFNLVLSTSTVPNQWKQACIRPIQKSTGTQTTCGLSTHLHHSSSNTGYGTIGHLAVSVPCIAVAYT